MRYHTFEMYFLSFISFLLLAQMECNRISREKRKFSRGTKNRGNPMEISNFTTQTLSHLSASSFFAHYVLFYFEKHAEYRINKNQMIWRMCCIYKKIDFKRKLSHRYTHTSDEIFYCYHYATRTMYLLWHQ